MKSATVRAALGPSRLVAVWLALLHAATLVPLWALCWLGLPVWTGTVLSMVIFAHGAWAIRRFARLKSPWSVVAMELRPGADCTLAFRRGGEVSGLVEPSTVVLGSLVVLAVKGVGLRTRRAIVAPDMLAREEFRRLRVALKWGERHSPQSASPAHQ